MENRTFICFFRALALAICVIYAAESQATPANKTALKKHYGAFLAEELNRCTTCHLPSATKNPESLKEFPHNPFGHRLKIRGEELKDAGKPTALGARLQSVSHEDSDSDGIENGTEILLASNPGDAQSRPADEELARAENKLREFAAFLAAYRWEPFQTVTRPKAPAPRATWGRNDIDAFISAEHQKRGLTPRSEAPKEILMRRVYMDLVGLNPTPEERRAFLGDTRADAYERLVDRLLDDPRHGERWGRHWMDIWRYSDWAGWSGGNQIRDSKPHIWRWRDWIVESVNKDKPYDRMIIEMLAADELAPTDTNALRATGFLVRNYKMLSREQWLEDTVKHTSQAFLGVTVGCAKCHDHMTDPISQEEYYQLRAVFEPHQVRTDRVPGELDRMKNGLVRVYDVATNPPTYFFVRGDERKPDTNRVMKPGLPKSLAGDRFTFEELHLPTEAAYPDRREFVIKEQLAEAERAVAAAKKAFETARNDTLAEAELALAAAEMKQEILLALLRLEDLALEGKKESACWKGLAQETASRQMQVAVLERKLALAKARRLEAEAANDAQSKRVEAEKKLAEAQAAFAKSVGAKFKSRPAETYPDRSTGRRLAFARWVASEKNPLTARVAMNHVWLRHFGRGLVTTPENFGASGNPPTHPELLDWLAAEFMARGWSMKAMHRLILTSATYRMASTPHDENLRTDPDNVYLWRMPSRRLDAELVRDNLLHSAGELDGVMGGPEIDHNAGLTSKRRSVYLRIAAEKEVEFLKIFDGPAVTECYQRRATVMPQQALALGNSKIALDLARSLAGKVAAVKSDEQFIDEVFLRTLAREPSPEEQAASTEFLRRHADAKRARENFVLVMLNHNDFVTVR